MLKRLAVEYKQTQRLVDTFFVEQKEDVVLAPESNSMRSWIAVLKGPQGSPFEMGYFMVRITVPAEYPSVPPKMSFLTPIIHPNIHIKTGEVCLDVLKDQWTPIWSLESACRAVIAMLGMPEADSPLNCDAGNMIRAGDLRGYASLAYMVTIEYASDVDAAKNRFFSSALLDLKFA